MELSNCNNRTYFSSSPSEITTAASKRRIADLRKYQSMLDFSLKVLEFGSEKGNHKGNLKIQSPYFPILVAFNGLQFHNIFCIIPFVPVEDFPFVFSPSVNY